MVLRKKGSENRTATHYATHYAVEPGQFTQARTSFASI